MLSRKTYTIQSLYAYEVYSKQSVIQACDKCTPPLTNYFFGLVNSIKFIQKNTLLKEYFGVTHCLPYLIQFAFSVSPSMRCTVLLLSAICFVPLCAAFL